MVVEGEEDVDAVRVALQFLYQLVRHWIVHPYLLLSLCQSSSSDTEIELLISLDHVIGR